MTGAPISSVASGDNQYNKANRKGEIKLTKLNSDNYHSWADGMKILLNAQMMWSLVNGTTQMPSASRPRDQTEWMADDSQAKAWIYLNVEDNQHVHIRGMATANAMWEALKEVHGYGSGALRLNFLKNRFFRYKATGPMESIDQTCSNLVGLQMAIKSIRETESPTDLDVALSLLNSVQGEAYNLAKYHLEDMENLTLAYALERLKLVEQKIKNNSGSEKLAYRKK